MIHRNLLLGLTFALITPPLSSRAQDLTPTIPMGSLSAFPTIVQAGTHPTLTWDITLSERASVVVTIQGAGTIIPNRDLIMDVLVIGAPVKLISTSSNGNVSEKGTRIPGATVVVDSSVPKNEIMKLKDPEKTISSDGFWTLEVITVPPFGIDRLGYVSFTADRTIKINESVTSAD